MDVASMLGAGINLKGAQPTVPVTNLSPHVDGGESAVNVSGANEGTDTQKEILYGGAIVVLAALALLWFFGAIAFKGLPTI